MADVIAWLKSLNTDVVNIAASPMKSVIRDFSQYSVSLEKQYRAFYTARDKFNKAKAPFPYADMLARLNDYVVRERSFRIMLLQAMAKVNANPADYGLSVYGLSKSEVDNAYPGLRYNAADLRAVPVVVIGVAAAVAMVGLLWGMREAYADASKINLVNAQAALYESQGMSKEAARARADSEVKALTGNESVLDKLGNVGKVGIAALVAWYFFK